MFFGARRGRGRFGFSCRRGVWKIGEEGVDVEGKGDGVKRGLVEEGACQIAETELLRCGGGRTGPRMVGYWEKILDGGLSGLRINAGERVQENLHVGRGGDAGRAL